MKLWQAAEQKSIRNLFVIMDNIYGMELYSPGIYLTLIYPTLSWILRNGVGLSGEIYIDIFCDCVFRLQLFVLRKLFNTVYWMVD